MKRSLRFSPVAGALLCLLMYPAVSASVDRPAIWAQPVALAGVPNLHKVIDTFYRSAQPTAAGLKNLEKLGARGEGRGRPVAR